MTNIACSRPSAHVCVSPDLPLHARFCRRCLSVCAGCRCHPWREGRCRWCWRAQDSLPAVHSMRSSWYCRMPAPGRCCSCGPQCCSRPGQRRHHQQLQVAAPPPCPARRCSGPGTTRCSQLCRWWPQCSRLATQHRHHHRRQQLPQAWLLIAPAPLSRAPPRRQWAHRWRWRHWQQLQQPLPSRPALAAQRQLWPRPSQPLW